MSKEAIAGLLSLTKLLGDAHSRNVDLRIAELDRKQQREDKLLDFNLNLLGEQVNQYNQNLNKLEQVGLTDIALDKIPEKDRTTGSKALTNLTLNEVNKQLGVLSDNIAVTDKVIGDYTKGKTITASQIDSLGKFDGIASDLEIDNYILNQQKSNPDYAMTEAERQGIRAYSVDPETSLRIKSLEMKNKKEQLELDMLPDFLKQSYKEGNLKIDKLNLDVEDMEFVKSQRDKNNEILDIQLENEKLKLSISQIELANAMSEGQTKELQELKNNIQEQFVSNLQNYNLLGSNITSSIYLQTGKNEVVPLAQIIDLPNDELETIYEKMDDRYSYINEDIKDIVLQLQVGFADETISNYKNAVQIYGQLYNDFILYNQMTDKIQKYTGLDFQSDMSKFKGAFGTNADNFKNTTLGKKIRQDDSDFFNAIVNNWDVMYKGKELTMLGIFDEKNLFELSKIQSIQDLDLDLQNRIGEIDDSLNTIFGIQQR